ncbi:MAG: metal ABC transporter permease [Brachymonas sp.]
MSVSPVPLNELLALPVVLRSFLALCIASIGLPIVGVLIIGLEVATVRFAVMHLALLGIAFGLWIGMDPMLSGLVIAMVGTGMLAPLAARPGGLGGPMGFLMTIAIAAALLVLSLSGVNATGAFELLWGSILATRPVDLALLGAVSLLVLGLFLFYRRQIALVLFDQEMALVSGIHVPRVVFAMLLVIAAAIASSIRLTGALLADSLTLLPALAARNLASSFASMTVCAISIGLLCNLGGFLLALVFDQPPGPVLVLTSGAVTLLSFLFPFPFRRSKGGTQ